MAQRRPIVIAHHLIWTAYGWWLPNDPRGSTSRTVASSMIAALGELHFGRKKLQPAGRIVREFYDRARNTLKHELMEVRHGEVNVVAHAFANVVKDRKYTCYACAIMPDHVHVLIRKHRDTAEEMIAALQDASRTELVEQGMRPTEHPVWTSGSGWKVFLDHPEEVERTVRYIEKNPTEIGLPRQRWSFVNSYDRWPLHDGHSPNSPYAKALRAAGRYP